MVAIIASTESYAAPGIDKLLTNYLIPQLADGEIHRVVVTYPKYRSRWQRQNLNP